MDWLDLMFMMFGRIWQFHNFLIALLFQRIVIKLLSMPLEEFSAQNVKTCFSTMITNAFRHAQKVLKIIQWPLFWWEDWLKECFVNLALFEDVWVVQMTLVSNALQILPKIKHLVVLHVLLNVNQISSLMDKDAQTAQQTAFLVLT